MTVKEADTKTNQWNKFNANVCTMTIGPFGSWNARSKQWISLSRRVKESHRGVISREWRSQLVEWSKDGLKKGGSLLGKVKRVSKEIVSTKTQRTSGKIIPWY